jgi:hypothetical protein
MVQFFSLTIFLQIIFSCPTKEGKIEKLMYDCIIASYENENIDIEDELKAFEKDLIASGYLESTNGEAYYNLFKRIEEENVISLVINVDKYENIFVLSPRQYYSLECLNNFKKIDSIEIANSKPFMISKEFNQLTDISLAKVAKVYTNMLSPEDFETKYYKTISLLIFAQLANIESDIERTFPSQKEADFLNFPKMSIKLTEKNEILLNAVVVSKEKMFIEIKSFILNNGAEHYIQFGSEKETSYSYFCEIQNCILSVYAELLNEKSREIYNKSYEELNETEKIKIDEFYPKNIAE